MAPINEIHDSQLENIINKHVLETSALDELRGQEQRQKHIIDDISNLEIKKDEVEKLQNKFDFWNFLSFKTLQLLTPALISEIKEDFIFEIQSWKFLPYEWSASSFIYFINSKRFHLSDKDYCHVDWSPSGEWEWEYANTLNALYENKVGKRTNFSFHRRRKWNLTKSYSTDIQTVHDDSNNSVCIN